MQVNVSTSYLQSLGYSASDLVIPHGHGVQQCQAQVTASQVTFTIPYAACGTTQQVSCLPAPSRTRFLPAMSPACPGFWGAGDWIVSVEPECDRGEGIRVPPTFKAQGDGTRRSPPRPPSRPGGGRPALPSSHTHCQGLGVGGRGLGGL